MMNSGTLVDRRLEAGHGDKVAIRCAGEEVTYAQLHGRICARRQRARRARRRPRGPRADGPRRHADVPGAVPGRDAHRRRARRRSSFLDTTENFAHYARDSYAKLIVAEDAPARAAARGRDGAHRSSRRCWLTHAGLTDPGRHAPRRHGLLAVQRRLDRLPEGRRAPAPRHPVHVRDVRQGDPRRSPRTTSRSPRPSSTTRTGWATT